MKKKTQLPLRRSQTLANGNELADLGTYIKSDGQVGTLGQVRSLHEAATLPPALNDFYWRRKA